MELQEAVSLIQGVGFPIVMCFIFIKREEKQAQLHHDEVGKLSDSITTMSEAIHGFRLSVDRLLDRLDGDAK